MSSALPAAGSTRFPGLTATTIRAAMVTLAWMAPALLWFHPTAWLYLGSITRPVPDRLDPALSYSAWVLCVGAFVLAVAATTGVVASVLAPAGKTRRRMSALASAAALIEMAWLVAGIVVVTVIVNTLLT